MKTSHFTNFGVSQPPSCADEEGYLNFREGFQIDVPLDEWTEAESWINSQEDRIENWRK